MESRGFVLLDRDGVINLDSKDFIKSPEEWYPIPGSLEAIALLNAKDYDVVVITNQSGLARGLFDEVTLASIHDKMRRMLAEKGGTIKAIYYCPHGPDSHCDCRKPKPGLLKQFAQDTNANLSSLYFIGDSLRDMQAAQAVDAKPLLVKTGKGAKTITDYPDLNIPIFENLYEAAKFIISEQ